MTLIYGAIIGGLLVALGIIGLQIRAELNKEQKKFTLKSDKEFYKEHYPEMDKDVDCMWR